MQLSKLAVLTALTAALAGCGQASSILAAKTNDGTDRARFDRKGGHGGASFAADLGLTADQQAALKALMEKNKPAAPPSPPANSAGKALHDLILGEKIDDAALRAAIAAAEAERAGHPHPDMAANLKGVYDILTADQRAKIVAKLQAAPAAPAHSPRPKPSGDPKADRLAKLNLTADQKAAWDALEAAHKANFEARKPGDLKAAMIAFWQTGDTAGLKPPTPPAFPVEAFVKAVEILDQTQRKALFGHGFPGGPGGHGHGRGHGHGGHGGPGGPGGFGGFGGPGGHEGPGGFGGFGGPGGHEGPGGFGGFGGPGGHGGHGGPGGPGGHGGPGGFPGIPGLGF